jgi:WD40 repeat protein
VSLVTKNPKKEVLMTSQRTRVSILVSLLLLAFAASAGLTLFNRNSQLLANGEPKADEPARVEWCIQAHDSKVTAIAISPDNRMLASGDGDGKVKVWDMTGKKPVEKSVLFTAPLYIRDIHFSPDGKYVAALPVESRVVMLWRLNMDGNKEVTMHARHQDEIWSVAFSPDSKTMATAGARDLTTRIWDLSAMSEKETTLKAHKDTVEYVCYSPNGKLLASSGEDGMIYVWNLEAGDKKDPLAIKVENDSGSVWSLQFSADGKSVVSGTPLSHKVEKFSAEDLHLLCWDATSGKVTKSIVYRGSDFKLNAWAISPDLSKIVLADDLGLVSLYGSDKTKILAQWKTGVSVRQMALAVDGESIVTGNQDGTICLIKLPHQK